MPERKLNRANTLHRTVSTQACLFLDRKGNVNQHVFFRFGELWCNNLEYISCVTTQVEWHIIFLFFLRNIFRSCLPVCLLSYFGSFPPQIPYTNIITQPIRPVDREFFRNTECDLHSNPPGGAYSMKPHSFSEMFSSSPRYFKACLVGQKTSPHPLRPRRWCGTRCKSK